MADNHEHENDNEIDEGTFEFGENITIVDENGKSYEMEHIASIEMDGVTYMAFCEANLPDDDEAAEVTIFRLEESEDGEELVGIEDDDELERAYNQLLEAMEAFEEEDKKEAE